MGTVLVTFREMRFLFIASLAVTVSAAPQANFGKKIEVNERLGLLANDLGLDPTAETSQSAALTAETSAGASAQLPSGRVPGGEEIGEPAGVGQKTCCYDASIDLTVFGRTCVNPQTAAQAVPWTQGCQET